MVRRLYVISTEVNWRNLLFICPYFLSCLCFTQGVFSFPKPYQIWFENLWKQFFFSPETWMVFSSLSTLLCTAENPWKGRSTVVYLVARPKVTLSLIPVQRLRNQVCNCKTDYCKCMSLLTVQLASRGLAERAEFIISKTAYPCDQDCNIFVSGVVVKVLTKSDRHFVLLNTSGWIWTLTNRRARQILIWHKRYFYFIFSRGPCQENQSRRALRSD